MAHKLPQILIGNTPFKENAASVQGEYVNLLGETYYKIYNYDAMEPFFMSIISSSDHWLFISSTGGLSAGRSSAEQALFPYYTEDKLTENSEGTGSKTILLVTRGQHTSLWEPFSVRQRGCYSTHRNLYKNESGTALVFEEENIDLDLTYRYAWRTCDMFGFVKSAWLLNKGDECQIELLDGLQNILPANVTSQTQNTFSCLLDAYKRSELEEGTGLGIFALNSTLSDLAEPSESLLATSIFQLGLNDADYLLSSAQLDHFRSGAGISPETENRGHRAAYFAHATFNLPKAAENTWHFLADVSQDSAAVTKTLHLLGGDKASLIQAVETDIAAGQLSLWKMVASSDGAQISQDGAYSAHHFANVMFNLMRGGVFANQYWIDTQDFAEFVTNRNRQVAQANAAFFVALPERISVSELLTRAGSIGSADLTRLSYAYLPLTFSRRHGDPSRPWNRFSINIKKPNGALKLDYEGNWRDIFQNWEALAYSFPEFTENMLSTFLNATTADGYNPYRITHHGLDWEAPEPGNPWANIGYWSDHQIIYLQKLMEISAKLHPGKLQTFLARPIFSYSNVPYRLKPYTDLLHDPYNSIQFDWDAEKHIEARVKERGSDGKLVYASNGQVLHVSLAEKLLTLLLAKLSNFVPEGGIWMNTQRPEWNDANNALVGKGLSVVTLAYLRRSLAFCIELLESTPTTNLPISSEVISFYQQVADILGRNLSNLQGSFNDDERRAMLDALGQAGSQYRWNYYTNGFSGQQIQVPASEVAAFLGLAQRFVEHSLRANRRSDNLYHAYNILHLDEQRATVGHLYEMLEGQVAILSSGMPSAEESLLLLETLRHSALYRQDQHTYILYPDKTLPGFLQKNRLSPEQVADITLFAKLAEAQDKTLVTCDVEGYYHFSGHIRNFKDAQRALDKLKHQENYTELVEAETGKIRALFEKTFHHDEFTGRSGTFFAYEGLGSIYWHMISKLLLATQEITLKFKDSSSASALLDRYRDIRLGLGFNKSPDVYGAFPTDPYSHTPKGQGARQPGMTGMVKEEILTRQAELGLLIENGKLVFDMFMLNRQELLSADGHFNYVDINGREQNIPLPAGSLAYTICQIPIIIQIGEEASIQVHKTGGNLQQISGHQLDLENSLHIFQRDGEVQRLVVSFSSEI